VAPALPLHLAGINFGAELQRAGFRQPWPLCLHCLDKDSAGVIKAMETQWPGLAETSSLELSAKVNTGEQ
jgi:hypothetical protein